jgi:hypothetical protein
MIDWEGHCKNYNIERTSDAKNYIFISQLSYNADVTVPTNHWISHFFKKKKKRKRKRRRINQKVGWDY